jgi:signal transduction histidine kinase
MVGPTPPRTPATAPTVSDMAVTAATTAWDAMRAGPRRYFGSLWPLRALAYLVSGVGVGLFTLVYLPVTVLLGAFVLTPVAIQPLVALERRRLALLGGGPLPDPHRVPDRPGLRPWLRVRYGEAVTWRELAYTVLHATGLLDAAAVVVGLVAPIVTFVGLPANAVTDGHPALAIPAMVIPVSFALLGAYAVALVAVGHGEIARLLLANGDDETVRTLTRSRARLIDAFEVERRRIERDLHDGAQQRLVALTMTLGLAELERDHAEKAHLLVTQAGEQARAALTELRDLIRGIHPRVLTDLGLPAAVAELADACAVPLTLTLDLPDRLPSAVESTAYFVVAEALTNTVRHAKATRVWVSGAVVDQTLAIEVLDDGVGGADPAGGTGLAGLADRVDALGGALTLSSPDGGPTSLRLELPCSG